MPCWSMLLVFLVATMCCCGNYPWEGLQALASLASCICTLWLNTLLLQWVAREKGRVECLMMQSPPLQKVLVLCKNITISPMTISGMESSGGWRFMIMAGWNGFLYALYLVLTLLHPIDFYHSDLNTGDFNHGIWHQGQMWRSPSWIARAWVWWMIAFFR